MLAFIVCEKIFAKIEFKLHIRISEVDFLIIRDVDIILICTACNKEIITGIKFLFLKFDFIS